MSSGDLAVHSPHRKPRRRLTSKEEGKKKIPDYGTDKDEADRHKSDSEKSDGGPSKARPALARKASTSAIEHLRRFTR